MTLIIVGLAIGVLLLAGVVWSAVALLRSNLDLWRSSRQLDRAVRQRQQPR